MKGTMTIPNLQLPLISLSLILLAGCSFAPTRAPVEDRELARLPQTTVEAPTEERESAVVVTPYLGAGGAPAATPLPETESVQAFESAPPSTAVMALLDTAGQQSRAGKLDTAAATLERALRLEPRNPELWTRLAEVRIQQGEYEQAASLAAKSNNLAGSNAALISRNQGIIEQARQRKGALKKPG